MSTFSRIGFLSIGIGLLTATALPSAPKKPNHKHRQSDNEIATIEEGVADRLIERHVPGAAIVIVKDGKLVDLKCYGYRDFANQLSVTPSTPFCIGACTKAFTAMAAEIAVDNGSLCLNDSPQKYLPDFKMRDADAAARVTVRDLLSNRSGIAEHGMSFYQKKFGVNRDDDSTSRILHVISGVRPTAKPGEKYQPSNLGYCVAGFAIAASKQTTFDRLLTESIFQPLDMQDTRLERSDPAEEDARGYVLDKHSQPRPRDEAYGAIFQPASGIVSSPRDMAKWLELLTSDGEINGHRLVSQRGYEELVSPAGDTKQGDAYGLGWDFSSLGRDKIATHTGVEPGYAASVTLLLDRHIGIVVMTNLEQARRDVADSIPKWVLSQMLAAESNQM